MKQKSPETINKTAQFSLIYGVHPIVELLKAKKRKLVHIYTTNPYPKSWKQIAALLPAYCTVHTVTRAELARRAGTDDHQSVVGYATDLEVRKKMFDPATHPFIVMLDGIQDTRNMGAIVRSAYCVGVDGVIITEKNSAPINASTLKASAGLLEHVPVMLVPTASAAVAALKQAGYTIYLATLGGTDATKVTYKKPLCLVIGSEGPGISPEISSAGTRVMLPQKTADISYNASVAAGILLFSIYHQNIKS